MLFVPLLHILGAHRGRETARVITWLLVLPCLPQDAKVVALRLHHALWPQEAGDLGCGGAEIEPHIDGDSVIVEKHRMKIGHVAAVFPAEDAAQSGSRTRRLVPIEGEEHAADQMHHQIAADSRSVFLPAAPARETLRTEGSLWRIVEPSVPIDVGGRQIERRRVDPSPVGAVAAVGEFHHLDVADGLGGV